MDEILKITFTTVTKAPAPFHLLAGTVSASTSLLAVAVQVLIQHS